MSNNVTRAGSNHSQAEPKKTQALLERALQAHRAGRFVDAVPLYRKALSISPDHAEAHHLLALALRAMGDGQTALAHLRQAQKALSDDPMFLSNLGLVLQESCEFSEAVAHLEKAVRLNPKLPAAFNNLGLSLKGLERRDDAIKAFKKAIALHPKMAEAHNNLGLCYLMSEDCETAANCFKKAVSLQPGYTEAWNNLGIAFRTLEKRSSARKAFEQALKINPDHQKALSNLGVHLVTTSEDYALGLQKLDRAIELGFNDLDAFSYRATALSMLGRKDEAIAQYRDVLEKAPNNGRALNRLATLLPNDKKAELLTFGQAALDNTGDDISNLVELHFALAAMEDAANNPLAAISHFNEANRLQRSQITYDEPAEIASFERLKSTYTPKLFEKNANVGYTEFAPIFILGMPRSGTSLTEQILATHSQVTGLGELKDLAALAYANALHPKVEPTLGEQDLLDWDADKFRQLGKQYSDAVRQKAEGTPFITDKMPHNFRFIGLIKLVLPNAKIIHCKRSPADTCLSMYKLMFEGHKYSYNLTELGRYYRLYADLMDYWHNLLPKGSIYDLDYEALVETPESELHKLLAYCELGWEPEIMAFHENKRNVFTASFDQVRRPIYKSAVNSAFRYGDAIEPLLTALNTPLK